MTDFDARLSAGLLRLERAVPLALGAPTATRQAKQSRRPGRRLALILAVGAVLVASSLVVAGEVLYPDMPEPALEEALRDSFIGVNCMTEPQAREAIQADLDGLGMSEWGIDSRNGAATARCVVAAVISTQHLVALWPAPGLDVLDALDVVQEELITSCMGRAEATQLVRSVLDSVGFVGYEVHSEPWGMQVMPSDQVERYQEHVAAGCFVYSSIQHDSDGTPQIWLWGPWL